MKKYDLIIIGCGTSAGFLLSFLADAKRRPSVLILEKTSKVFRKIRASGNGRCNYSNIEMGPEQYYSFTAGRDWEQKAFGAVKSLNLQGYFYRKGIPSQADEYNRLFPYTNTAVTIAEYFEGVLKDSGAELQTDSEAVRVSRDVSGRYVAEWVNSGTKQPGAAQAKRVVFAAGGSAYPQAGTDGSIFKVLKGLGHSLAPQVPGIVPLETPHRDFRELAGMKIEAEIIYKDFRRAGEVLFTDYGISGPNALYASTAVAMDLVKGPVNISLNFLAKNELTFEYFLAVWEGSKTKTFLDVFRGALQARFLLAFLNYMTGGDFKASAAMTQHDLTEKYEMLANCPVQVTGTRGFKEAQVSLGGVPAEEVDPETFESKLNKGIYILGETLDYTGGCGGYNIHWCAATAQKAAEAMK